jgi:type I restriction enzyme S subunit
VKLGKVLRHRKDLITIDDLTTYRRPRVQLHAQGIVLRDEVPGALIKTKTQQVCRAGEFLVAEIDAKLGGYGLVPPELDGAIVSSHYFLFEIDGDKLDRDYVGWFSKTSAFRQQVEAQGTTNYAAIRASHVLGYEMPVPPLAEQRRIATRLQQCEAAMQSVKRLQLEIEAERAALTISVHSSLSSGRVVSLGEVLELHEESVLIELEGEYPQIGIKSFGGGLFKKAAVTAGQTTYRAFNRVYSGAVVLSQVKGWEGAVAVATPDVVGGYLSPEYRTFRCKPGQAHPEYLRALIGTEWFWRQLAGATRGVGARRERTRPEQFLTLTMPMPSFERQVRGIDILSELQRATGESERRRASLDAVVPALLNRTFDGHDQTFQHD